MVGVYGNEKILEEFSLRGQEGRLPHSLLILGDQGGGKKTLAKSLAQLYLRGDDPEKTRHLLETGNHPDFHLIQDKDKGLKKQDMMDFIEESQKTAYLSESQVFLIDHVDDLTPQGQNALLKSLEEPKSGVAVFLTGTNKGKILPTILSRCRIIQVPPLGQEEVRTLLKERGYGNREGLEEAVHFSRGSLGRALDLLDQEEKIKIYQDLFHGVQGFSRKSRDYPFVFSEFFLDHKDILEDLVFQLLVYYRDLLLLREDKESKLIYLPDRFQAQGGQGLKTSSLYTIIKTIQKSMEYFSHNGNKRLGIEALLIKIQEEYL